MEGLSLTGDNCTVAWKRLLSRYENKGLLISDHLNALWSIKSLKEESSVGLQSLLDTINSHREALQALDRPINQWDDWFVHAAK